MIISGTITKKLPSGEACECSYMIDTTKGTLVQIGGEADIVAEDIDLIAGMMDIDPATIAENHGAPKTTEPVTDTFTKGDTTVTVIWGDNG